MSRGLVLPARRTDIGEMMRDPRSNLIQPSPRCGAQISLRFTILPLQIDLPASLNGVWERSDVKASKIEGEWTEVIDRIWRWQDEVHQVFPHVETVVDFAGDDD